MKKTYNERIKDIQDLAPAYNNVKEFYKANPYLYRWSLKNGVDIKKYFPKVSVHKKYENRENKGINAYKVGTKKLYKHYPFVLDCLRDLDLTYYWVNRVLDGKIDSVNGFYFERCTE